MCELKMACDVFINGYRFAFVWTSPFKLSSSAFQPD